MTTHEKARLIELANSLISDGETERLRAGEWNSQYMVGWHCGGGNRSISTGKKILELINVLEIVEGVEI